MTTTKHAGRQVDKLPLRDSTATRESVSAALRRAGFNPRRTGAPRGDNHPLAVHGQTNAHRDGMPAFVRCWSRFAHVDHVSNDGHARNMERARELAVESQQALIDAGYLCTPVVAMPEPNTGYQYEVARYPKGTTMPDQPAATTTPPAERSVTKETVVKIMRDLNRDVEFTTVDAVTFYRADHNGYEMLALGYDADVSDYHVMHHRFGSDVAETLTFRHDQDARAEYADQVKARVYK